MVFLAFKISNSCDLRRKIRHFKNREFGCELLILNRRKDDEKITVYRGTDSFCVTSVRDRHPNLFKRLLLLGLFYNEKKRQKYSC